MQTQTLPARSAPLGHRLRGVLPVVSTPYHDDEAIDFETLDHEIDWLFDQGVDGVVMGMVSDLLRLAAEEREALAKRICRRAAGRGVTVISVGAECTRTAIRFARHAERHGADALMAIPPVAVAAGEKEVLAYYQAILEAVRLPLIVQDASSYAGQPLSIELQSRLLDDWGDRVLFKPEATPIGPRLSALRDATGGRARVFEGTGGLVLVDSYRRGIVGTMPGPEIIDALLALWRALEEREEQKIYELSAAIGPLVVLQNSLDAFIAVEKYLLVKRGVFRNQVVRCPVSFRLDPETVREIDRLYDLLRAVLDSRS